eukprot:m.122592 g.122592  ORF g.122592 m.122592 type:complete len:623 (+) comp14603_c1_seq1:98-1966(+)
MACIDCISCPFSELPGGRKKLAELSMAALRVSLEPFVERRVQDYGPQNEERLRDERSCIEEHMAILDELDFDKLLKEDEPATEPVADFEAWNAIRESLRLAAEGAEHLSDVMTISRRTEYLSIHEVALDEEKAKPTPNLALHLRSKRLNLQKAGSAMRQASQRLRATAPNEAAYFRDLSQISKTSVFVCWVNFFVLATAQRGKCSSSFTIDLRFSRWHVRANGSALLVELDYSSAGGARNPDWDCELIRTGPNLSAAFAVPQQLQPHSALAVGLGPAQRPRPTALPATEVDLHAVQANLFALDAMNSLVRETALLGGTAYHAQNGAALLQSALGPITIELLTGPLLAATEAHIDPRTIHHAQGEPATPLQQRVAEFGGLALALLFRRQHKVNVIANQHYGKSISGERPVAPPPVRLLDTLDRLLTRLHVAETLTALIESLQQHNLPGPHFRLQATWAFGVPQLADLTVLLNLDVEPYFIRDTLWAMRRSMAIQLRSGRLSLIDESGVETMLSAQDSDRLAQAVREQLGRSAASVVLAYVQTDGFGAVELAHREPTTATVMAFSSSLQLQLAIVSSIDGPRVCVHLACGRSGVLAPGTDLRSLPGPTLKAQLGAFIASQAPLP